MSAIGGGQTVRTFEAEAAFGQGLAVVKGTGDNQAKLPGAANVAALGIAYLAGDPADPKRRHVGVVTQGEVDVVAGGAFAPGDPLRVAGPSGKLVKVGGEAVGEPVKVIARAMETAAGDGDQVAALISQFTLGDQVTAEVFISDGAAAADYGIFFIADAAMELIEAVERHKTAGSDGSAVTLMVAKAASGTALASGTDMLAAGVDLKAAADTNQTATLHATQGNRELAAGDAVGLVETGTLTAVAGVSVRLSFRLL